MKHKVSPFNPPISGPRQPASSQVKAPAISGPIAPLRPPQQVAAPTAPCCPVGPKIVAHVAMKPQTLPAAPTAPVMPPRPSQIIAPPKAMPVAPRIPIAPPPPSPASNPLNASSSALTSAGTTSPGGFVKAQASAGGPDLGAIAAAIARSAEQDKIEKADLLKEIREDLLPRLHSAFDLVKDFADDDPNAIVLKAVRLLSGWEVLNTIFTRLRIWKRTFADLFDYDEFKAMVRLLDAAHDSRNQIAHIAELGLCLKTLARIEVPFRELVADVLSRLEEWIEELAQNPNSSFEEMDFWDFYQSRRTFRP